MLLSLLFIIGFLVLYVACSDRCWKSAFFVIQEDEEQRSVVLLRGLLPGTSYRVFVKSVQARGGAVTSGEVDVTTPVRGEGN